MNCEHFADQCVKGYRLAHAVIAEQAPIFLGGQIRAIKRDESRLRHKNAQALDIYRVLHIERLSQIPAEGRE